MSQPIQVADYWDTLTGDDRKLYEGLMLIFGEKMARIIFEIHKDKQEELPF